MKPCQIKSLGVMAMVSVSSGNIDAAVSEDQPKFNLIQAMGNFLCNRPAIGATLAAMGMFIGMQAASTAVSVTFQIYFRNPRISGLISMFAMLPIVIFTPLARKMVTKYGKKELSIAGSICYIVGGLCLFAAPLGIIPVSEGNTGADLIVYILAQLVMALGLGIYSTVSWAMMGDAIDYNEWKTGKREEGTVYSLHSFFRKLAQGVGPALALTIMQAMGYVNNANPNAAGEFTAIDVTLFSWGFALQVRTLVAALYLVAGVMMFIGLGLVYNLDKKALAQMNGELDARRGDLFSYAVSDLGRNADTMFSTQCLLDSLFQSRTEAEQRFRQALDDASLHLRLSLNVAVALGR